MEGAGVGADLGLYGHGECLATEREYFNQCFCSFCWYKFSVSFP